MNTYRVYLYEYPGDKDQLIFDCYAEDHDHAAEQAENAYPESEIRHTMIIPEADYMRP